MGARSLVAGAAIAIVLGTLGALTSASAQTARGNRPPQPPATARGPSPAAGTLPRMSDGKPNLNGIWQALTPANWDIQDHGAEAGVPAGQGIVDGNEIPYRPEALDKKNANHAARATADPLSKCYLPGVPRAMYLPFPFQILQTPRVTEIAYEFDHATRQIYTDGSKLPGPLDLWMGDSRGHWEGDTLIVDVTNFAEPTWFDMAGNFHSDALHVVERYTMRDRDHINYEATIDDPKVFTRSWKMSFPLYRRLEKNVQLLDYVCVAFDDAFHPWNWVPPGLAGPGR